MANRPFPHSTSVRSNNSSRARLRWTFSYIWCIFVHPDLDSAPLFVGMWERSIMIKSTIQNAFIAFHWWFYQNSTKFFNQKISKNKIRLRMSLSSFKMSRSDFMLNSLVEWFCFLFSLIFLFKSFPQSLLNSTKSIIKFASYMYISQFTCQVATSHIMHQNELWQRKPK